MNHQYVACHIRIEFILWKISCNALVISRHIENTAIRTSFADYKSWYITTPISIWINLLLCFKDETGNKRSMDRKLDHSLFLIVKRNRNEHQWQFPQGKLQPEELTLRQVKDILLLCFSSSDLHHSLTVRM
jgi:hypothetical protein